MLGLYDKYTRNEGKEDKTLFFKNIENLAQSIWNLFADSVGQIVFDQETDLGEGEDESDYPLFAIDIDKDGVAKRHYIADGRFEPLFQHDMYDYLIVGMADEVLDGDYDF